MQLTRGLSPSHLKASFPIRCSCPTCGIADRGKSRRRATNESDRRKPSLGLCCIHQRNVIPFSGPFSDLHEESSFSPAGQSLSLSSSTPHPAVARQEIASKMASSSISHLLENNKCAPISDAPGVIARALRTDVSRAMTTQCFGHDIYMSSHLVHHDPPHKALPHFNLQLRVHQLQLRDLQMIGNAGLNVVE